MGKSGAERREAPRAEIQIEINYQNLDLFYTNTILNLSQGGMFIKTDSPLPLGTEIALEFTLTGQEQQIKAVGLVVWQHPLTSLKISSHTPGMGIKLKQIPPQDLRMIRDFVENLMTVQQEKSK